MGLAGQKERQRISSDPNNLNWSNDTSKFGFRMMAKMGWAPGKGLGANEDGSQDHVKIRLKDDNLGLGAKKNQSDNWLGNTDAFSRLLADLNSNNNSDNDSNNDQDSKKRKAESDSDDDDEKKKKKKAKKDKKDKKEKKAKKDKKDKKEKKAKKDKKKDKQDPAPVVVPIRNAARAKFLKAKRMATQHDPARLNEILGIKA
ncbi:G-patch-domain-containing protein [Hesseltinella vesiculosa]|uniref:G-patch-domain-containing protein n=1 Tax=Hesseltinella vesiculosa TaxID=101127 RepID=A0A1X2GU54_9FUNG|nr:G-patch-domain-containing protein [Hesseltinella vesiculosa]